MELINIRLDIAKEKIIVLADTRIEVQKEKRQKKINGASATHRTISNR